MDSTTRAMNRKKGGSRTPVEDEPEDPAPEQRDVEREQAPEPVKAVVRAPGTDRKRSWLFLLLWIGAPLLLVILVVVLGDAC